MKGVLLAWAVLMALLAAQLAAATLAGWHGSAPLFGIAASAIVLVAFMRLGHASSLMRLFGAAGLVWLLVLLGMGVLDPATRKDYPAPITAIPIRR